MRACGLLCPALSPKLFNLSRTLGRRVDQQDLAADSGSAKKKQQKRRVTQKKQRRRQQWSQLLPKEPTGKQAKLFKIRTEGYRERKQETHRNTKEEALKTKPHRNYMPIMRFKKKTSGWSLLTGISTWWGEREWGCTSQGAQRQYKYTTHCTFCSQGC